MQTSTELTNTSTDEVIAINKIIDTFLDSKRQEAIEISPYYQDLWAEIARLVSSGGKRLRPKLVLIGYRALGGKDIEAILPAAAAMELLHQGMLIHDDIIDRDYVRYGVDNIAGSYRKAYANLLEDETDRLHFAHSAAILAGDLMISESYLLMTEAKVAPEKIVAIQKLLNQSIYEVVGGELLDTEASFRDHQQISPETVAIYKTASYTFALPLLVGAELAGATISEKLSLKEFARNLGIAFQLRDDIIGVFADESKSGKSSNSDILEGKHTYMVEQFYKLASSQQSAKFNSLFGRHDASDAEVEEVRQLLQASGAVAATEQAIDNYEQRARAAWGSIETDLSVEHQIDKLIQVATKRDA